MHRSQLHCATRGSHSTGSHALSACEARPAHHSGITHGSQASGQKRNTSRMTAERRSAKGCMGDAVAGTPCTFHAHTPVPSCRCAEPRCTLLPCTHLPAGPQATGHRTGSSRLAAGTADSLGAPARAAAPPASRQTTAKRRAFRAAGRVRRRQSACPAAAACVLQASTHQRGADGDARDGGRVDGHNRHRACARGKEQAARQ